MKKFFALLMCAAMVFSGAVVAHAASNPCQIEELGMSIEIPDTFKVATASEGKLEGENTYLEATSEESGEKITVTVAASESADLQNMTRKEQTELASGMYAAYEEQGLTVAKYNIYHNDLTTFIRAFYNNADKSLCGVRYYTVLGGQEYEITLEKTGEIVADDEMMLREVVDSAAFGAKAETADETAETTGAAGETEAAKTAETSKEENSSNVLPIAIACGVVLVIVIAVVVLKKKGNKK